MTNIHTFHIPVMGTAFSIDTPIKVAKYGISSVISLVDDTLIEEMRQYYCKLSGEPYEAITKYQEDYRARRITAYLNLVDKIVKQKFEEVRDSCFELGSEITKYFEMLAGSSPLKKLYNEMLRTDDEKLKKELQTRLRSLMRPGDINVNIMTKLDRANFDQKRNQLADEFSDALSALRGYAKSSLDSAIVFSAGINRRLYSYVEKFEDFYSDAYGAIKKRIILKVSDYRSAIIQGRFFAKKGLWVSEYRIESGLNCGGHAFATEGHLMGPILEEFKRKRNELKETISQICNESLTLKKRVNFQEAPAMQITAQGGIGTFKEQQFLMNYYDLDATGWATPFLLVPEVTNVDLVTLDKLSKATENELYLSEVSPLGVPFNNIKDTASDSEKDNRVHKGKPGSACPKGHLVSNTEFTDVPICTASRQYQKLKIEQLESYNLPKDEYDRKFKDVVKKACICHDLGEAVLIKNNIETKSTKRFPAICPGPNLAYFSKISTLADMAGHIYGRLNLLNNTYRPNMFVNELKMYVEYFIKEIRNAGNNLSDQQIKYFNEFRQNLLKGIQYYQNLFPKMVEETHDYRMRSLAELLGYKRKIEEFASQNTNIFSPHEHDFSIL